MAGYELKFKSNSPAAPASSMLKQALFSRKTVQEPCLLVLSACNLVFAFWATALMALFLFNLL
jgi:hypothetical protein